MPLMLCIENWVSSENSLPPGGARDHNFLGYKEEEYYMADDEVNKASTSFLRNRFERYYLRLKCKKFLKFHE